MTLHDYIAAAAKVPFRYGRHDCAQFASGWIQQVTGRDVFPSYKTKRDGIAVLGDRDIADFLTPHFAEVGPLSALPGDVAILPSDDGIGAFGIVTGDRIAAFSADGMAMFDLLAARRVFRIAA